MRRGKRGFSYPERYAIWHCNERRCWLCKEPLRLAEVTVDHVLPEWLLDDEGQREATFIEYGLPKDFNINGYENWLPCHNHCNQIKSRKIFTFVPGYKMILERLRQRAYEVERTALSVSSNASKDTVFSTTFAALEKQTISMRDLDELLQAFVDDPAKAGVPSNVTILDSGYWIRKEQIAGEGICRCEQEACVGRSEKVHCYFQSSLSPWIKRKGLFWKCYDEIISCPRCSGQHKRGHVGRADVCGRPYLNQKTQSD
jgi:hypothetical protein